MEITAKPVGEAMVVSVSGRLDPMTGPDFEQEFEKLMDQGNLKFVADLGGLEYISSAGLRSILSTAKKLKAAGGVIVFANLQGMVRDVFDISGFGAMFAIHPTVDEAVDEM